MTVDINLEISQKGFEKFKEEAIEESKSNIDEEVYVDEADYRNILIPEPTIEFEQSTGQINCSGFMWKEGSDMGFLSISFEMDLDLVTEIVNYYMKKLGKLKTVLEATK